MDNPLGQFGSAGYVSPRILPHPTDGREWCCASFSQQELKLWDVTNIFVATNTQHSTLGAMGKWTPAQPELDPDLVQWLYDMIEEAASWLFQ